MSKTEDKSPRLDIVELKTNKVVHTVKLPEGCGARTVERVLRGLLINFDSDRFLVREVNCP